MFEEPSNPEVDHPNHPKEENTTNHRQIIFPTIANFSIYFDRIRNDTYSKYLISKITNSLSFLNN